MLITPACFSSQWVGNRHFNTRVWKMEMRKHHFASTEPNITSLSVVEYFEINGDNWMNFLEISLDDVNESEVYRNPRSR